MDRGQETSEVVLEQLRTRAQFVISCPKDVISWRSKQKLGGLGTLIACDGLDIYHIDNMGRRGCSAAELW